MKKALLLFSLIFFTLHTMDAQLMVASESSGFQNPKSAKLALKIYPNPATDFIGINDQDGQVARIRIVNLVGKELKNLVAIKGKKHPINDIPRGLYLVQMVGNDGKVITTQRLRKR